MSSSRIRLIGLLALTFMLCSPSILFAADPVTPPAFILGNQTWSGTTPHPDNPYGFRIGLQDYFNQGSQMANGFEHGFVGLLNAQQKWSWTSYVGSVPSRVYLPPCESPTDSPCIESVSTRAVGQTEWQMGMVSPTQFKYNFGSLCSTCQADLAPFIPIAFDKSKMAGGTPSMWSLPQAPHGGGIDYRVDVQLNQTIPENNGNKCIQGPCTFVQIVPLKLGPSQSPDTNWGASGPKVDYTQYEFPKNIEYRIVVRLQGADSVAPDGFFFGRIENLQINNSGDSMKRLTIQGTPTRVPFAEISGKPMASIPTDLIPSTDWLRSNWTCTADVVEKCVTNSQLSELTNFSGWEKFGLKTIGSGTIWEIRAANPPSAGVCSKLFVDNGITGTLTVNSTVYSSDVPSWSQATHSFTFSVGSTHLDENGQKNRGFYQLTLKSEIVKCLWGPDATGASAVVQIVSEDGSSQVASTSVRVQDGTFYFTAANFEYSNPKLKITFKKFVVPVKNITITCVKGKSTQKISGAKPVCPSDWKKKA